MKRKREDHSDDRATKRQKNVGQSKEPPTWPLLRQYYPQLTTLRLYLASKLSGKRRKKVLQYGLKAPNESHSEGEIGVTSLLDDTVVGSFQHQATTNVDLFDKDLTVFTQKLSNSTAATTSSPNRLNQSEVGCWP